MTLPLALTMGEPAGIGGERSPGVDAGVAQRRDCGRDDLDILAPKPPGFAGMGIKAGDDDDWRWDRKFAAQRVIDDTPHVNDRLARQGVDRSAQRHVDRHRHNAQLTAGQHHHRRVFRSRQFGEIFGMAGMAKAGSVKRVLIDRIGDERSGPAGDHIGDRVVDRP